MQKEKIKILVTSAGTASAISVIKALKWQTEFEISIFAVDTDMLAAGLYLADAYKQVPPATSPDYIQSLIDIAVSNQINYLIPIYSKEIEIIAQHKELLSQHGIVTFISTPDVIELCNNKERMHAFAVERKIPTPHIYSNLELIEKQYRFPLFAKPRTGSSSTGTLVIQSEEELKRVIHQSNLIIQEFIDGQEITIDVLCNARNEAFVIAPRIRLSTKSGQSVKGRTIDKEPFVSTVSYICKELGIVGPCNLQFFVRSGQLIFIELNPRFAAGGLMLSVKAGANIPLLLLKLMMNKSIQSKSCVTKPNYIMTRYWEEIIFEDVN